MNLDRIETDFQECYQCGKEVEYLFEDSRCAECTRVTPEEMKGE